MVAEPVMCRLHRDAERGTDLLIREPVAMTIRANEVVDELVGNDAGASDEQRESQRLIQTDAALARGGEQSSSHGRRLVF